MKNSPRRLERPDPENVRGTCPRCGEELVSFTDKISPHRYQVSYVCWGALALRPTCDYRRVL